MGRRCWWRSGSRSGWAGRSSPSPGRPGFDAEIERRRSPISVRSGASATAIPLSDDQRLQAVAGLGGGAAHPVGQTRGPGAATVPGSTAVGGAQVERRPSRRPHRGLGSPKAPPGPAERPPARSGRRPGAARSTVTADRPGGHVQARPGASRGGPGGRRPRAGSPRCRRRSRPSEDHSTGAETVDRGSRLGQRVEAAGEVVVVAVEDERLVEEGAQRDLRRSRRRAAGAGSPRSRRRTRPAPSPPAGGPPAAARSMEVGGSRRGRRSRARPRAAGACSPSTSRAAASSPGPSAARSALRSDSARRTACAAIASAVRLAHRGASVRATGGCCRA